MAAVSAWAEQGGGQVRRQPGQRLGAGGVAGDGGGRGERLGSSRVGRQVRRQRGQRLGAGVVVGDGGSRGERLGQHGWLLVGGQVRRQPRSAPGRGRSRRDGGGRGERLGSSRCGEAGAAPATVNARRGRRR